MKPAGLTLKYNGELSIVHQCKKCGTVSYNRIAGDDNPQTILSLLDDPIQLRKIQTLTIKDKEQVLTALFGYSHSDA